MGLRARGGGKAFALLSGGVDSSVAALLAMRAGLDVTGVTMRQSDDDSAARAAGEFCRAYGIESRVFDLRKEFAERVIEPFKAAYMRGDTPNPCAMCNPSVKFGLLWERVAERFGGQGFLVVSGHYARTERVGEKIALLRGACRSKDQSYFLCMLPQSRVDRLLLPLGELTKADTREMARALGAHGELLFKIAEKPESMEICFSTDRDYRKELAGGGSEGPILNVAGESVGTHGGIENYTIGQRKGLGLTSREPLFVIEIRPRDNAIIVADRSEAMTREVCARNVNILAMDAYRSGAALRGKIRSQSEPAPCVITRADGESFSVAFDEAQFAPAPGQYLVLYDGERLVAGGCIERRLTA